MPGIIIEAIAHAQNMYAWVNVVPQRSKRDNIAPTTPPILSGLKSIIIALAIRPILTMSISAKGISAISLYPGSNNISCSILIAKPQKANGSTTAKIRIVLYRLLTILSTFVITFGLPSAAIFIHNIPIIGSIIHAQ